LVANSGNFLETTPLIWKESTSPFRAFQQFSQFLEERFHRKHGIALTDLAEALFDFLTKVQHVQPAEVAAALWRDYQRGGRSDRPPFLRPFIPSETPVPTPRIEGPALKRQARRLVGPPV
jgi:hypothetical protein